MRMRGAGLRDLGLGAHGCVCAAASIPAAPPCSRWLADGSVLGTVFGDAGHEDFLFKHREKIRSDLARARPGGKPRTVRRRVAEAIVDMDLVVYGSGIATQGS